MNEDKFDFRFREKYLRGQLDENEKKSFEDAMLENPDLVAELKRHIYFSNWVGAGLEQLTTRGDISKNTRATQFFKFKKNRWVVAASISFY